MTVKKLKPFLFSLKFEWNTYEVIIFFIYQSHHMNKMWHKVYF